MWLNLNMSVALNGLSTLIISIQCSDGMSEEQDNVAEEYNMAAVSSRRSQTGGNEAGRAGCTRSRSGRMCSLSPIGCYATLAYAMSSHCYCILFSLCFHEPEARAAATDGLPVVAMARLPFPTRLVHLLFYSHFHSIPIEPFAGALPSESYSCLQP